MDYKNINLAHILLFSTFLFYLAYNSKTFTEKSPIYTVSLFLGIAIIAYHGKDVLAKIKTSVPLINLFHALVVGPLLIWIWKKKRIGYQEQSLLYTLAGGSALVHAMRYFGY